MDFGARHYSPALRRWTSLDPTSEKYYTTSPYVYCNENPVNLVDPDGRSTHTDSLGRVIAVYNDNDLGVYRHSISFDEHVKKGYPILSTSSGTWMGKTEYWDEFVSPETGEVMTHITIDFSLSFDSIVMSKAANWKSNNLVLTALESIPGGDFDIKSEYPNSGGVLNGFYVTSRSAGNFLAGLNASKGSFLGAQIEFDTFQKLSGALHLYGAPGLIERAAGIIILGNSYGLPQHMEN